MIDDEPDYRRTEQLLDRLYADWVAAGRPKAPPTPKFEGDFPMPTPVMVVAPPGLTKAQVDELLGPWSATEVTVLHPPAEQQVPHLAPDLEVLIPRDLASPPMVVSSVRAADRGSSLLNRALKRLETRPREAIVVIGIGGRGEQTLAVTILRRARRIGGAAARGVPGRLSATARVELAIAGGCRQGCEVGVGPRIHPGVLDPRGNSGWRRR